MTHGRGAHPLATAEPGDARTGAHWFALQTRSRASFAVRDALRDAGVPEFLPTFEQVTRWSDRSKTITRPLFAGYLFARFPAAEASKIAQTRGVVQILSIDQQPVTISDDEIESLRRVVESPVKVSPCPYVSGDTVTVQRGPFFGVTGVVSRVKGATLLSIPVQILGRSVQIQIEAADVAAAQ